MEPWEAIDLDDSDLPSLLRPCNRQRHQPTSVSEPILRPCSRSSFLSESFSTSSSLASSRLIPGPAGAVQAAMRRRTQDGYSFFGRDESPLPTQEYIRRVVENGDDLDVDFASYPWLSALNFVRSRGLGGDNGLGTPLSSIKSGFSADRVSLVVAIIKSCSPNGLGDLMVTLKDPTGNMGASIHRKVFTEGDFAKDISVGAVLLIRKAAVFSPSRATRYLNITLSNVVKVIPKDSGPPLKSHYCESSVKHPAPAAESIERIVFAVSEERTAGIMNNLRQNSKLRGNEFNDKQMDQAGTAVASSCTSNKNGRNQNVVKEKEISLAGQSTPASNEDITASDQDIVTSEQSKRSEIDNPSQSTTINLVEIVNDQEDSRTNGVKETMQPPISQTSPPKWTDEQLDELLAFD